MECRLDPTGAPPRFTFMTGLTACFQTSKLNRSFCTNGIDACAEISKGDFVPQKVRELVAELERAGFVDRGGKGSHRNFVHPMNSKPITISGAPGDDAKHYQVRAVKRAIEESKS